MKKLLLLSSFCLLVLLQTLPFAAQAADPKEYVTIYYDEFNKEVNVSDSNGNFKEIPFEKVKGRGNQTQLLKIMKEYNALGYEVVDYEYRSSTGPNIDQFITVLMEKK